MNKYFLTEEQIEIQNLAKDFSDNVIAKTALELDKAHKFPTEEIKQCGEIGFLGVNVPEEWGGAGLDCTSHVLVMEQLARNSVAVACIIDAHSALGVTPLRLVGTEEQKQKYLIPAASGKMLCSFALTEPQGGSDAGLTKTKAVLDGDEWVINGNKTFITNLGHAGIYAVACKTDPTAKGSGGISMILVPAGTPGFEIGKSEVKMCTHSMDSGDLFFTDCRVPKENLLGELNKGFPLILKCLDEGRLAIAAIGVGMAQGVLERAARYANTRIAFGQPIGKFQGIQFQLAEMAAEIEGCRMMLYNVCRMAEAGIPFFKEAAEVKMLASEMAVRVAEKGVQILGGYGLCEEYEMERFYRDAKLLTIGEGTSEILRSIIGGAVLKEYKI